MRIRQSFLVLSMVALFAACGKDDATPAQPVYVQPVQTQTPYYNGYQYNNGQYNNGQYNNQNGVYDPNNPYGYQNNGQYNQGYDPNCQQQNQYGYNNNNPNCPQGNGILPAPTSRSIQTGCYYVMSGVRNCSPCPVAYVQSGNNCVQAYTQQTQLQQSCHGQQNWGGYSCMPQTFNGCPGNSNWNWNSGACVSTGLLTAAYYEGWRRAIQYNEALRQYQAYYYYIQNAPRNDCFFNGYGWVGFQAGIHIGF